MEKKRELAKRLAEVEGSLKAQGKVKDEMQQLERRCQHLQVTHLGLACSLTPVPALEVPTAACTYDRLPFLLDCHQF